MLNLEKVIADYRKKGQEITNVREVKSGKEATLFLVNWDGKEVALKVYVDPSHRSFQATDEYVSGKYNRNPSERRSTFGKSKFGKELAHRTWVRREFYLLQRAKEAGANVPEVYGHMDNSVLMQFIGENSTPAPRLVDVELSKEQADQAFKSLLRDIRIFSDIGVVHSDLSGYNILYWKDTPYVIDFPQAVDVRENPNSKEFLKRDLDNLIKYFSKFTDIEPFIQFKDMLDN